MQRRLKLMNKRYRVFMILFLLVFIASGINMTSLSVFAAKAPLIEPEPYTEFDSITLSNSAHSDITMTYSFGYNFYGKYGRQIPIFAELQNINEDFRGWLEVSIPLVEKGKIYRKEVDLLAGETKKLSMLIPLMGGFGQVEIKLIDEHDSIVLESINPIKLGNYEKILFAGVLTDSPDSLEYVDNLEIKSFLFNKETFPEDTAYLDMFDILIINDYDTSLLNDKQVGAVHKWVLDGGLLVLGSGEKADKVISSLANEFGIEMAEPIEEVPITDHLDETYFEELKSRILRFEEERNVLRENIGQRNKNLSLYNNPLISLELIQANDWPSSYIKDYSNPHVVRTLANASFIDEEQEGSQKTNIITTRTTTLENGQEVPVYHRKELAKGSIVLYNLDLSIKGDIKGANATMAAIITSSIVSNLSTTKQMEILNEQNGSSIPYPITNSMSYTDTENIPRVTSYVVILIIYILIIGPIAYLILNKKDKHSLIWIVVPVMAVVFTFVMFLAGDKTRVEEAFIGYVKMRKFTDNNMVEDELYFSLTAPYNDNYTVELSSSKHDVKLMGEGNEFPHTNQHQAKIDPKKYTAAVNYGLDNTTLEVNNNPAFTPVFFEARNEYIGSNPLETDIHYTGDIIEGTITNKSNYTISNAVYIGDVFIINLGTIYSGQTLEVSGLDKYNIHDINDIYSSDIIESIARNQVFNRDNYVSIEMAGADYDTLEGQNIAESNNESLKKEEIAESNDEILKNNDAGGINRKRDILYYLIDRHITTFPEENCIIGFVENSDTDSLIWELPSKFEVYGTNAILSTTKVDYSKDGNIFVASISSGIRNKNTSYFGNKGGYYASESYPITIGEEESIIEYYLPSDEKIISIEYYALSNQDPLSRYNTSFVGNVYAQNRKTGEFDHIYTGNTSNKTDTTLISSDQIKDYLTKDNILTLRYEPNYIQIDSMMLLPKISYWKDGE